MKFHSSTLIITLATLGCTACAPEAGNVATNSEHGSLLQKGPVGPVSLSDPNFKAVSHHPVHPSLSTAKVAREDLALPLHLSGLIEPDFGKEVDVTTRIAGRLRKVLVRQGQSVSAHEVMAVLDSKDVSELQAELVEAGSKLKIANAHQDRESLIYDEQVARPKALIDAQTVYKEAKAKRDLADAEYKRVEDLYREKISSAREFQAAKANLANEQASFDQAVSNLEREKHLFDNKALMQHDLQVAKAETARAKQHLDTLTQRLELLGMSKSTIREIETSGRLSGEVDISAPVSGVVTRQDAESGEVVHPDKPIFTIVDLSTVIVRADVPEVHVSRVKMGNKVKIKVLSYPKEKFIGSINFISEHVNPQTHTVAIRAQLNNSDRKLKKDMSASIELEAQTDQVLVCPRKAVFEEGGKTYAFVKNKDGRFDEQEITLGGSANDVMEIVSGLKEGDEVAIEGLKQLRAESSH